MQQSAYRTKALARVQFALGLALVGTLVCLSGCFSSNPEDIMAYRKPYEADVTALHYVLQPPDEVEIHCARVPEIDKQRQRIRPDGKISFEALGEIDVAGKTPAQVGAVLEGKVAGLYTLPGDKPIDVRVVAIESKVYYVFGQVYAPGRRLYTGRDTVVSAIADARCNPMAWKERIQVVRPSANPEAVKPKIFEINLARVMINGDLSNNVLLEEGDIVYVPPTILAYISLRLEEIITPIARAFSGVYYVSGGETGIGPYGSFRR